MRWPTTGQTSSFMFSPDRPDPAGNQANQGTEAQSSVSGPALEEPSLVLTAAPWPITLRRDLLSQANGTIWHPQPELWAVLPESMPNTISQARVPSMRRLYALKWSVFSAWSTTHGADPVVCNILLILSFVQDLLEKGCSPSTLKVYVAAIAASYAPIDGQSVGRNNLVVRFLRGSKRLNPPCPVTIPKWDLPTVLRALKSPPFEPLQSVDLHPLMLKTALLRALASVKIVLKLRHGYIPKVLSTPFRAEVITLSALPPLEQNQG